MTRQLIYQAEIPLMFDSSAKYHAVPHGWNKNTGGGIFNLLNPSFQVSLEEASSTMAIQTVCILAMCPSHVRT